MEKILNINNYLDQAEYNFLFCENKKFIFPVRKKSDFPDFYTQLESELRNQSTLKIYDLRVVKEGFVKVSRPASLCIELDVLLRHRPHLTALKDEINNWPERFPNFNLHEFAKKYYRECFENLKITYACADVLIYLTANQESCVGLLPREIAHGQSTKLIGYENLLLKMFSYWREVASTWSDFYSFFGLLDKPAEFRFFAPRCNLQKKYLIEHHGILSRDFYMDYDFSSLKGTLIIENHESFYRTLRSSKETLVIWGSGWKASSLRHLHLIFPKPIFYWGDLDKEGYEIYGYIKKFIPDINSIFMDLDILNAHAHLLQKKVKFYGPYRQVYDLQKAYEWVCSQGLQIEQEQLQPKWPYHQLLN